MKTVQQRIAERKAQLTAAAEYSETALDQLAAAELAEQTAKLINEKCDQIDKLMKSSGIQREWKVHAKYEYGVSAGAIGRFITQWVYLPDTLKSLTGLNIPTTAFNSNSLENWGRLPYCNALGVIIEATQPNLESVKLQVEMVRYYLGLDYVEPLLTMEQWENKAATALAKAQKKQAEVEAALLEDSLERELGLPTFTI